MNTDISMSRTAEWPAGADLHGQASNHAMVLWLRVMVVDNREKADWNRQVHEWEEERKRIAVDASQSLQGLPERASAACASINLDVTCLRSTQQPVCRKPESHSQASI